MGVQGAGDWQIEGLIENKLIFDDRILCTLNDR